MFCIKPLIFKGHKMVGNIVRDKGLVTSLAISKNAQKTSWTFERSSVQLSTERQWAIKEWNPTWFGTQNYTGVSWSVWNWVISLPYIVVNYFFFPCAPAIETSRQKCKLYCKVEGTSKFFLLKEKVIDGTSCGPDPADICVNGVCKVILPMVLWLD